MTESFLDSLRHMVAVAKEQNGIKLEQVFHILAGRGYAALLIVFSFPFCFPVTIPGTSFPFGAVLAFCGLRIAFAKHLWWPEWILNKTLTPAQIEDVVNKATRGLTYLQKVLHPRLCVLTQNPWLHRFHGCTIFVLAVLLSLPIPFPFSNMICALPLLFFGLGLLEDDGYAIIIAYVLACLCLIAFMALFIFGKAILTSIF
jgi:hypothetical protein